MRGYWFLKGLKIIAVFALYIAVLAWVVMHVWNMFIPEITGWQTMNYNNSLLLIVLVKLLVGFRMHGAHFLKHKFGQKWSHLSEEERDKLREKFRDRWCRNSDN